jgi:hypothetical protein
MTTESTTGATIGSNGTEAVVGGAGGVGGGPSDTAAVEHSPDEPAALSVGSGSPTCTEPGVDALLVQSEKQRTDTHP